MQLLLFIYFLASSLFALPTGSTSDDGKLWGSIALAKDINSTRYAYAWRPKEDSLKPVVVIEQTLANELIRLKYLRQNISLEAAHVRTITEVHEHVDVLMSPLEWWHRLESARIAGIAHNHTLSRVEKRWAGQTLWDLDYNLSVGDYSKGNWKVWNSQCGCFM